MSRILKKILGLCVASTLAWAAVTELSAAASEAAGGLSGKVVTVNRAQGILTMDIEGRLFSFRMHPQIVVLERDRNATLETLKAGQRVWLTATPDAGGRFEVTSVSIGAPPTSGKPVLPVQEPPKPGAPLAEPPKPTVTVPAPPKPAVPAPEPQKTTAPARQLPATTTVVPLPEPTDHVVVLPPRPLPVVPPPALAPTTVPLPEPPAAATPAPTIPLSQPLGPADLAPSLPLFEKPPRNEVSLSGDFLIGEGDVTMPIGFSLRTLFPDVIPLVEKPERSSEYYGVTLSYSFNQEWYLDLGYSTGESSGNVDLDKIVDGTKAKFSIDDDWYQAYVRYMIRKLGTRKLQAYLRAGFTYVQSDLRLESMIPPFGFYTQDDQTDDLLGNLGFGLQYSLFKPGTVRMWFQLEGEGFYGIRSQKSLERLPEYPGVQAGRETIDNDLYGAIGRGTLRFEYAMGQRGRLKAFADAGVQGRFTFVKYSGLGTYDELLWGPYVKVGLRYAF